MAMSLPVKWPTQPSASVKKRMATKRGAGPMSNQCVAESGTTMPRIICEEVAPIDAANMIRRLHERCEDIAAVRASENGFVDAVEYRRIELPGYAVRKLEGGFRG